MNWWIRSIYRKQKEEPKANWKQAAVDKLRVFRKRGETFRYLGVTMMVTGHWTWYGCGVVPSLQCDYVDAHGVVHHCSFGVDELPTLERENTAVSGGGTPYTGRAGSAVESKGEDR